MAAYGAGMVLMFAINFYTVSGSDPVEFKKSTTELNTHDAEITDLRPAASVYYSRRNDPYGNDYGVTGHGILGDKRFQTPSGYDNYNEYNNYDGNHVISGHGYIGTNDRYKENFAHTGYSEFTNNLPLTSNAGHIPYSGNGGYGGYGGNGGLGSYLGYNNPYYHGANHLGYGYYNKPGLSSIYKNGITPSLVTGYRGYSRK